jgi:tetrapyrrole methylase family protein / MazG family protein
MISEVPVFRRRRLHIFGLGIKYVSQITLEANFLLQRCDHVFFLERDTVVSKYLAANDCKNTNLWHLYRDGRDRLEAYREICDTVLTEARRCGNCGFLTTGNPIFLNTIVEMLLDKARARNVQPILYSGVSCIDSIISDLRLPVGRTGLQCFEASRFVTLRPVIDVRVPLLLFQPNVVMADDVRHTSGTYKRGVQILEEVLLTYYKPSQQWCLLRLA